MESLIALGHGFAVALEPQSLLAVTVGVLIGMAVGVLPGLGPAATIAILLPLTYTLSPEAAIIMLAGIYYGSMYGGTITSVLLRLPGEAASVVTTFDGYPMARRGRAGAALGVSAVGSFVGGVVSVVGLIFLAPLLAKFALRFGPPEFAVLGVMGLLLVIYLGQGSPVKGIISAGIGLLVATVGFDLITGTARFTFGTTDLMGGLDFVAVVMGVYGVGEVLLSLEGSKTGSIIKTKLRELWPSRLEWKASAGPIARGTGIGFFFGLLPGGGGLIASIVSYGVEKKRAKDPSRFGKGAVEGVAGPETANNAGSTSAFIPMLVLGIPPNAVLALLFGALLVHGVVPGPQLVVDHPGIFWGVIASMVFGNLILLVLNFPLIGAFVQILRIRPALLAGFILVIALIGVYSLRNSLFDVWVMLAFGILGYLMRKTGFDPSPMVLAVVIGPIIEESVRQALLMGHGNATIFVTRPISGIIILLTVVIVAIGFLTRRRSKVRMAAAAAMREDVPEKEDQPTE